MSVLLSEIGILYKDDCQSLELVKGARESAKGSRKMTDVAATYEGALKSALITADFLIKHEREIFA